MTQYYIKDHEWDKYVPLSLDQICESEGLVKGGWVSVKDREPEWNAMDEETEFCVRCESGNKYIAQLDVTGWCCIHSECIIPDVTHWLEETPPPSEEAEAKEEITEDDIEEAYQERLKLMLKINTAWRFSKKLIYTWKWWTKASR